jgi:hypothetical protein
MASFFARVELHGARWPEDYENLHKALKVHEFINCVTVEGGEIQRLPTGTYYSTNRKDDLDLIARVVKKCADDTGYKNEVVVVKDGGTKVYLSRKC